MKKRGLQGQAALDFVQRGTADAIRGGLAERGFQSPRGVDFGAEKAIADAADRAAAKARGEQQKAEQAGAKAEAKGAAKTEADAGDAETRRIFAAFAAEAKRLEEAFGKEAVERFKGAVAANPGADVDQLAASASPAMLAPDLPGVRGNVGRRATLAARRVAGPGRVQRRDSGCRGGSTGCPGARGSAACRTSAPRSTCGASPGPAAPATSPGRSVRFPARSRSRGDRLQQQGAVPGSQAANALGDAAAGVGAATVAALGKQAQVNAQLLGRLKGVELALQKFGGISAQLQTRADNGMGSIIPRGVA